MTAPPRLINEFTCPSYCNMKGSPEDHVSAFGEIAEIVHLGMGMGLGLSHHDPRHEVGFDADTTAYTLPDGSPGRPFIRFSQDGDTYFDLHDLDELRAYQSRLIHHQYVIGQHIAMMEAWDQAATPTEQGQHWEAVKARPCTGRWRQLASAPPTSDGPCCSHAGQRAESWAAEVPPVGCPSGCTPLHTEEDDKDETFAPQTVPCTNCSAHLCANCRKRPVKAFLETICGLCG